MSQAIGVTPNNTLNCSLIGKTGHGKSVTGNSNLGQKEFLTSSGTKFNTKEKFKSGQRYSCRASRAIRVTPNNRLKCLLIGKTGHGKSATGNSILGRKEFPTSSGTKSKTKEVKDAWTKHTQYEVKVVDGPGLEDTDLNALENKKQACKNMARAFFMCNGGVHAFLLVIKIGTRFTDEERKTFSDLKQIFGQNYLKDHGIIVITEGDKFPENMKEEGTPDKTFKEWWQEQNEELFDQCDPRIVLFNNRTESDGEKERQRNELFHHVEELSKKNGLYTNEHFVRSAHLRDELMKREKLTLLKEEIQKKISLLTAELGLLSINSSLKDIEHLEACIEDVRREITEDEKEESVQQLNNELTRMMKINRELKRTKQENNTSRAHSLVKDLKQSQPALEAIRELPWKQIFKGIGAVLVGVGVVAGCVGVYAGCVGVYAGCVDVYAGCVDVATVGAVIAPMSRILLSSLIAIIKHR